MRKKPNRNGADFFKSDLRQRMPETVFILGPGINGASHYDQIPDGAFVILLNRAVAIPNIQGSLWMAMDGLSLKPSECNWFNRGMQLGIDRLFGTPLAKSIKCEYSFQKMPKWHLPPKYKFIRGALRGGRSILGCALQACLWAPTTHKAVLIGCDGKGPYYDGSRNIFLRIPDRQIRNEFPDLQIMVDEMTKPDRPGRPKRMTITSLSETILKIPREVMVNV